MAGRYRFLHVVPLCVFFLLLRSSECLDIAVDMGGGLFVDININARHADSALDFIVTGNMGVADGWLAIGFSNTESMVDSDVVIAFQGQVQDRYANPTTKVEPVKDLVQSISYTSTSVSVTVRTMKFTRPFTGSGSNPFDLSNCPFILAAVGPMSGDTVQQHTSMAVVAVADCTIQTLIQAGPPCQNDMVAGWQNDMNAFKSCIQGVPGWTADKNDVFDIANNWPEFQNLFNADDGASLGSLEDKTTEAANVALKISFNAVAQWPQCPSIGQVRNQGDCGSCWAVAVASAASDRSCICNIDKTNETPILSAEDVLYCTNPSAPTPCGGGRQDHAWQFWKDTGVVTEACVPYVPDSPCETSCTVAHSETYANDKHGGDHAYHVPGPVLNIMREIRVQGPITAQFKVYSDFRLYKSGVYINHGGMFTGWHVVKIIGWGTEGGKDYWLVVNSWGTGFGNSGTMKFLKGVNHLEIERWCFAGWCGDISTVDDPHFVVSMSGTSRPMCFDVQPKPKSVLQIISDPRIGVFANGRVFKSPLPRDHGTYFDVMHIMTRGVKVVFTRHYVTVIGGPRDPIVSIPWTTVDGKRETQTTDRVNVTLTKRNSVLVTIRSLVSIRVFRVGSGSKLVYLNMVIADKRRFSSRVGGLLGEFVHKKVKESLLQTTSDKGQEMAILEVMRNKQERVVKVTSVIRNDASGRRTQCWRANHADGSGVLDNPSQAYVIPELGTCRPPLPAHSVTVVEAGGHKEQLVFVGKKGVDRIVEMDKNE